MVDGLKRKYQRSQLLPVDAKTETTSTPLNFGKNVLFEKELRNYFQKIQLDIKIARLNKTLNFFYKNYIKFY